VKEDKGDVRLPLTQKLGKIKFFCDVTPPPVVDTYLALFLKKEVMNFSKMFLHIYQTTRNYTVTVPQYSFLCHEKRISHKKYGKLRTYIQQLTVTQG
jgi:hypothetical protein